MIRFFLHITAFFMLKNFGGLTLMLLCFIGIGTVVFHFAEGWDWVDSYYFSVMTLSTVGYGDLHPTTPFTKIFTTFYILGGLGIILNFVTVFYEHRQAALNILSKKADETKHR
ncbi:potassium channel family protein [Aquimarina celericrescens]|uniref:Potassium channel family protein n=1 Tax=Aquimarina celericrescens TaxID=1964542 RepID=A0ABW5AU45_9FLAO|nr:two pore domain potassium channel family protein [Aquimarina celericrescens]